mmetsp:Transcript_132696/g.322449  ORF Transcript_132696/g.322449 Transcript_132696/m.322449 type:complete len:210 (+) Transcript_132696:610-1239(+)
MAPLAEELVLPLAGTPALASGPAPGPFARRTASATLRQPSICCLAHSSRSSPPRPPAPSAAGSIGPQPQGCAAPGKGGAIIRGAGQYMGSWPPGAPSWPSWPSWPIMPPTPRGMPPYMDIAMGMSMGAAGGGTAAPEEAPTALSLPLEEPEALRFLSFFFFSLSFLSFFSFFSFLSPPCEWLQRIFLAHSWFMELARFCSMKVAMKSLS